MTIVRGAGGRNDRVAHDVAQPSGARKPHRPIQYGMPQRSTPIQQLAQLATECIDRYSLGVRLFEIELLTSTRMLL